MLRFFKGKPGLGIEITSSAARLAAVSKRGAGVSALFAKTVELPAGMVNETYASPNIVDEDAFSAALREGLAGGPRIRRAALSLPDGVFRVQTFDFDELPGKSADRDRLIRWRIEKAGAFDASDTVLRHQVLRRQDKGFTVLACVAKKAVIAQYESALVGLGLEPWSIGPSSFYVLNFFLPFITGKSRVSGLVYLTKDSFATIVAEAGGVKFYRYKEVKRGSANEIRTRFMREIEDSLHFYSHMDRAQQTEIQGLFFTGEPSLSADLAEEFKSQTSLDASALSPSVVVPSANGAGRELAAALSAGCSL